MFRKLMEKLSGKKAYEEKNPSGEHQFDFNQKNATSILSPAQLQRIKQR